jgi:hypothetical protein
MNIAEMIVSVGLVTEFFKRAFKSVFRIDIGGKAAVILSIIVSIGVVFVYAVNTATPFTFALIPILIQVAIGANAGYALLTLGRGKSDE